MAARHLPSHGMGFPAESMPPGGDHAPFVWHVNCLFREHADFMFDWMASIFQNPYEIICVRLVLVGGPACGKTSFVEGVVKPMVGAYYANFITTTNCRVVAGNQHHAVLACSDALVGNHAYFATFANYCRDERNLRAVYDFLMARDLTGIN